MINQVLAFHRNLEKGECVKVITTIPDYCPVFDKTDILTEADDDNVLLVLRANGRNFVLNCDYVVAVCVTIKEWI